MDNVSKLNEEKWNKLVLSDVPCSQPRLNLTPEKAGEYLKRVELYDKDIKGKRVLCLACGGGQQSIGFALLDAEVTVVDFSAEQLKKDKIAADTYDKDLRIIKSDMRDLTMLKDEEFDIVYQPYSINYIPDINQVFDEVTRVLKPGGVYDIMFHNPYVHGSWKDGCWGSKWSANELWNGKGYPIWQPYKDGYPVKTDDPNWNFQNRENKAVKVESPQEFRHTLSTIINGLINRGFEIINFQEETGTDYDSTPGTWEHYTSCAPPWLYIVCKKR